MELKSRTFKDILTCENILETATYQSLPLLLTANNEEFLKKIPPNIYKNIFCATATNINVPDCFYDVVLLGEIIEHLSIDDARIALREFHRILKNNGCLLLTTPNPNYFKTRLGDNSVWSWSEHVSKFYVQDTKRLLKEIGFVDIKIYGSGRVSNYLGEHFPILNCYGSYLAKAFKRIR